MGHPPGGSFFDRISCFFTFFGGFDPLILEHILFLGVLTPDLVGFSTLPANGFTFLEGGSTPLFSLVGVLLFGTKSSNFDVLGGFDPRFWGFDPFVGIPTHGFWYPNGNAKASPSQLFDLKFRHEIVPPW